MRLFVKYIENLFNNKTLFLLIFVSIMQAYVYDNAWSEQTPEQNCHKLNVGYI